MDFVCIDAVSTAESQRKLKCAEAHPTEALIKSATSTAVQSAAFDTAIRLLKAGRFLDRPIHCNNPTNHCNSACRRPSPDG